MPTIAAVVDEFRAVFGVDEMNQAMKQGMKSGDFWAIENGHIVGTPPADALARQGLEIQR